LDRTVFVVAESLAQQTIFPEDLLHGYPKVEKYRTISMSPNRRAPASPCLRVGATKTEMCAVKGRRYLRL
jgi:hypothetical protein